MGSSSSSKQSNTMPTGSTVSTPQLPSYMQPYVADVLSRARELSYQPYTPYKDQRIAEFTPEETSVHERITALQPPGQYSAATDFATRAGNIGLDAYKPAPAINVPNFLNWGGGSGVGPEGVPSGYQMEGPERVAAERASTDSFVQPGVASQYMSPYMQNVVDVQKQEATRDAQKAQLGQNLGAARQGTYGGARQLLAQTEREKALGQQLGQIQATGSQAAYDAAQRQFEAEQERKLQAQKTNILSQLEAALANQKTEFETGRTNLDARMDLNKLYSSLNFDASKADVDAEMEARRLGLIGTTIGLDASKTLGDLGSSELDSLLKMYGAKGAVGEDIRNMKQRELDMRYQDFRRQYGHDEEQLRKFADLLSGVPSPGPSTVTSSYSQPSSLSGQLLGAAGSLGSAYMLSPYARGEAKGGEIKAYNNGGLVALAEGGVTGHDNSVFKLRDNPKDILYSTMGDPQKLKEAIQKGADPTAAGIAAMLAKRIYDAQAMASAPTQTTIDGLLNPRPQMPPMPQAQPQGQPQGQPQMPSAGLASAPLPDNAFTAAEGGIVGYGAGDSVKYDYLAPYIPEGVEYTPPKPAGYSIYDVLKKPFASAEEKINELEKLIDFLTATSSEKDKLNERRKLFNKSLPELRVEAEAKGLPILPGVEEINTKQIPQRRQVSANVRDEELNMGLSAITPTSAPATQQDITPVAEETSTSGLPTLTPSAPSMPDVKGLFSIKPEQVEVPKVGNIQDIYKEMEGLAPYDTTARDALLARLGETPSSKENFWRTIGAMSGKLTEEASKPGANLLGSIASATSVLPGEFAKSLDADREAALTKAKAAADIENQDNARKSELRQAALMKQGKQEEATREATRFNVEAKNNLLNSQQNALADIHSRAVSELNANYRAERNNITQSNIASEDRKARLAELDKRYAQEEELAKTKYQNDTELVRLKVTLERDLALDENISSFVAESISMGGPLSVKFQEILDDEDLTNEQKREQVTKLMDTARAMGESIYGGRSTPDGVNSIRLKQN